MSSFDHQHILRDVKTVLSEAGFGVLVEQAELEFLERPSSPWEELQFLLDAIDIAIVGKFDMADYLTSTVGSFLQNSNSPRSVEFVRDASVQKAPPTPVFLAGADIVESRESAVEVRNALNDLRQLVNASIPGNLQLASQHVQPESEKFWRDQ